MDAWFDHPGAGDHFISPVRGNGNIFVKANQSGHPSGGTFEVAMSDPDDAALPPGHIRRMFIEDGDHPWFNRHRGDRFDAHSLRPYIAVADGDGHDTITGVCPLLPADNAALASSGGSTGGFFGHLHHGDGGWHHHADNGLCGPPVAPGAEPLIPASASSSGFAVAGASQAVPEPGVFGFATVLLSFAGLRRRRR